MSTRAFRRSRRVATVVESLEVRQLLSATVHGLTGEYFAGNNFQTPTVVRTDTKLNFNWRRFNAPDVLLIGQTFSAQLTGTLTPPSRAPTPSRSPATRALGC